MTQPSAGKIFHRALRECLSEGRPPSEHEIEQIAEKIWHDGFARGAGIGWTDVPEHSTVRAHVRKAARMALGAPLSTISVH
jgi:hypothetical protein